MRLVIDMNLSRKWGPYLVQHGLDSVHWTDVGGADALDTQIMDHARQRGFIVFTRDLDFGQLLALNKSVGPSVIQLRGGDPMPQVSGEMVVSAINRFAEQLASGALVTINLSRARVRVLPISEFD